MCAFRLGLPHFCCLLPSASGLAVEHVLNTDSGSDASSNTDSTSHQLFDLESVTTVPQWT